MGAVSLGVPLLEGTQLLGTETCLVVVELRIPGTMERWKVKVITFYSGGRGSQKTSLTGQVD